MRQFFTAIFLLFLPLLAAADASGASSSSQLLNLDFKNIATRDLLLLLAKFSQQNILISDSVKGEMSLQLQHVNWQQALDTILWSQGLAKKKIGNTIFIASQNELAQHAQQSLQLAEMEPLQSRVFILRYAKAQDLLTILQDKNNKLLSARASVSADVRNNRLWLEESAEQLPMVINFVQSFDVPSKQVQIEARIVNIDSQAEKDLGIRFGVSRGSHLSGTLAGANQLASGASPASISTKDRLTFDLPALPNGASPASFGLAMMKLADGFMLDLELSALEAEGLGKIIASPKLLTANQQTARIEAGEEIPYQEKTSSGATDVAFKKAVLSLSVTPQVTAQQEILLNLKISQDKPSSREVNGVPAINTREIETQVSVHDGQTLVLGGIYEESEQEQIERIPFLSAIPIMGKLFQHQHRANTKRELLIFVRPKIVTGESDK